MYPLPEDRKFNAPSHSNLTLNRLRVNATEGRSGSATPLMVSGLVERLRGKTRGCLGRAQGDFVPDHRDGLARWIKRHVSNLPRVSPSVQQNRTCVACKARRCARVKTCGNT